MMQGIALAADGGTQISPYYQLVSTCTSDLTISGSTAACKSNAKGVTGTTTKIVIDQYLEVKSGSTWKTDTSWSSTVKSFIGSATNYRYNLPSGTYRLKTVFTINDSETITVYSTEKTK